MKGSSGSPLTMSFQSPSSSEVSGSAMRFMMVRRSRSRTSGSNDSAARPGLRAFLLMDLPQQADEGASLVDQLFTPAGGFQFGHAGGDDAFGVDLEIRRIELEMALGLHERVAAGRHGVHIRLAHGEFRRTTGPEPVPLRPAPVPRVPADRRWRLPGGSCGVRGFPAPRRGSSSFRRPGRATAGCARLAGPFPGGSEATGGACRSVPPAPMRSGARCPA